MKQKDQKKLNLTKKVISNPIVKNSSALAQNTDKKAIQDIAQEANIELETWERPPCIYYTGIKHDTVCIVN